MVDRVNSMLATQTTLQHAAMATVVAAFGKDAQKAHRNFQKLIKQLSDTGETPEPPRSLRAEKIARDIQGHGR